MLYTVVIKKQEAGSDDSYGDGDPHTGEIHPNSGDVDNPMATETNLDGVAKSSDLTDHSDHNSDVDQETNSENSEGNAIPSDRNGAPLTPRHGTTSSKLIDLGLCFRWL